MTRHRKLTLKNKTKVSTFHRSNPSDPSLLDPILVSVWNRFWSDQALMKVEETPICLLETVLRFAAFLNLTRKNPILLGSKRIALKMKKVVASGCFLNILLST